MCHAHKQFIRIHRRIHKNRETVTTDTSDNINIPETACQPVSHLVQHFVCHGISMFIDQLFIVVNVNADKIKLLNEKRLKYNSATGGEKVQLKREILNSEKKLLKDQQQIQYLRNAVAKAERKR